MSTREVMRALLPLLEDLQVDMVDLPVDMEDLESVLEVVVSVPACLIMVAPLATAMDLTTMVKREATD
jgi:hypothetical protein